MMKDIMIKDIMKRNNKQNNEILKFNHIKIIKEECVRIVHTSCSCRLKY